MMIIKNQHSFDGYTAILARFSTVGAGEGAIYSCTDIKL